MVANEKNVKTSQELEIERRERNERKWVGRKERWSAFKKGETKKVS